MTYKVEINTPTTFTMIEISGDYAHTSGDQIQWSSTTHGGSGQNPVSISNNVLSLIQGEYYLQGSVAIDRTSDTSTYDARFYDANTNVELVESDGFHNAISQGYRETGSNVFQAHLVLSAPTSFYMRSSGSDGTVKADSSSIFIVRA